MSFGDITAQHVLSAIGEYDELGQTAFLEKYGYQLARQYWLLHQGRRYPSKAILGVAHRYAVPEIGPFTSMSFTGGLFTTSKLRKLGFDIDDDSTAHDREDAILLTWSVSPNGWPYENIKAMVGRFHAADTLDATWRVHAHRKVIIGQRFWLLKQGKGAKGIFGSGTIIGSPRPEVHDGKTRMMTPIRFDALVDPGAEFLVDDAHSRSILSEQMNAQASGVILKSEQSDQLMDMLAAGPWKIDSRLASTVIKSTSSAPAPSPGSAFVVGKSYNRGTDIHGRYGGQQRSGIITPKSVRSVIVFTGLEGKKHGYHDEHLANGVIKYFGEGSSGDMSFKAGNKAVRDHIKDGKELHVFQTDKKKSTTRYLGEYVCVDYDLVSAPGSDKKLRQAIVFNLVPIGHSELANAEPENEPPPPKTLSELRARAMAACDQARPGKSSESTRKVYERSKAVRDYVLARSEGACEGCGKPAPFLTPKGNPYLEPHHITKVSDGGPDSHDAVAALCPTCHRKVHHGADGNILNERLAVDISAKEARIAADLASKAS